MPPCEVLSAALSSRTHRAVDKRYSFRLLAREPTDTLHLFEAAIDLLSYATYLKCEGKDYKFGKSAFSFGSVSAKERDKGQQNSHSPHNFF